MSIAAPQISRPPAQQALIIDDHPLFCDALALVLRLAVGIQTVEASETLSDALGLLREGLKPDVILLDLNLSDVNGLDGLIRVRTQAPDIPVIVVSSMSDSRVIHGALTAGASGFVPKHSKREVFQAAFHALEMGETFQPEGYVSPGDTVDSQDAAEEALVRLSTLTNQQARILSYICDGKLNKQIAYELSIAETTVKAHVTAIMRKLGVQNRTQAVLIANKARYENLLPD